MNSDIRIKDLMAIGDMENELQCENDDTGVKDDGFAESTVEKENDELTVLWTQVAECIKTNSWKAIYAKTDAEYDQIVADMISQAKDYGYDECIAFQENEASLRKAAENEVKGTIK